MHTVTKVLVVFASILCVLLAALTMAYSVNVGRIVDDRHNEINRRLAAEAMAADRVAQGSEEQARMMLEIQQLQDQKTQLNSTITSLQNERSRLNQDLSAAVTSRDAIMGQIAQAVATSKTQALLIEQYRDEVTKLRDNELSYKTREIELTDRLNDLESAIEVKDQSVRALQEQLVEARRTIDSGGAAGANAIRTGMPYAPSIPITGKIVKTAKDAATGNPVATINVGTNNQVRKDMLLAITRGGEFVGNLVITKTDLGWAEGKIDYLGKKVEAREGDVVMSLVAR